MTCPRSCPSGSRGGSRRPHSLGDPRPGQRRQRAPHTDARPGRGRPTTASSTTRRRCGSGSRTRASTEPPATPTPGARPPGRALRGRHPRWVSDARGGRGHLRARGPARRLPDRMVVARNGSPLIVGVGERDRMYVALRPGRDRAAHDHRGPPRRRRDRDRDGERLRRTASTSPAPRTNTMTLDVDPTAYDAGELLPGEDAPSSQPPRGGYSADGSTGSSGWPPRWAEHGRPRDRAIRRVKILGCGSATTSARWERRSSRSWPGSRPTRRRPASSVPQPDHQARHPLRRRLAVGETIDTCSPCRRSGAGGPRDRARERRRQRDRPPGIGGRIYLQGPRWPSPRRRR